jgi:glycosyltransferase involved in cell wall biosynthesis
LKASKKLRALNASCKFDIVHNESPYGFFEAYLHKIDKTAKLVTTVHGVPLTEIASFEQVNQLSLKNLADKLSLLIEQNLFSRAEYAESRKIIAVSRSIKMDLVELFKVEREKIEVIYNGVDTDRFNPSIDAKRIRKQYGLVDSKIILYVGRLERRKGLYLLLEVAKRLVEEKIEAHFVIVGSGQYENELMKIGREVSKGVIFAGRVPDELLPFYYSAADIVAIPSLYEGSPITLLEAMASGKPIITTNIPPIMELVDNNTAVTICPNDVKTCVKKIGELLVDIEYRHALGDKARSKVLECFTWKKVAERTEKVYEEVSAR